MNNPTAIVCSDIHLRLDNPKCRTDNYFEALTKKIKFLCELQKEHNVPILCAGDLFDKPKVSPELEAWAIENLPDNMIVIPGQHDLPNHNIDLIKKSSLYVLACAGKIKLLLKSEMTQIFDGEDYISIVGVPYGTKNDTVINTYKKKVILTHIFNYEGENPWPGAKVLKSSSLMHKYKDYDLIITGDNHVPFVTKGKNRLLVNPGSFMRIKADQEKHKPRVYLWSSENNIVEPIYLPIKENVISREHIEKNEKIKLLSNKFVDCLKEDIDLEHNFVDNMKIFLSKNMIHKKVQNKIWEAIGD